MWLRVMCIACIALVASACSPPRSSVTATPRPKPNLSAQQPAAAPPANALGSRPLDGLLASVSPDPSSDYGVVIEDIASGDRLELNQDRVFASASVYKLPLAWQVLSEADRGHINLDDTLDILEVDAIEVEPEGGLAPGEMTTVGDALERMVSVSSNASAHALLRTIGRRAFNAAMDQLGLHQTRVPEVVDPEDPGPGAVTSAEDVALLLRLIGRRQALSPSAHDILRDTLARAQFPDALRETLPDAVLVLDKTGNLDDASNVGALLSTPHGTVLLVVLDEGVEPGEARSVIAQLARGAYDAYLE